MSDVSVIGERLVPDRFKVAKKQYLLYLRHLFVYEFAIGRMPAEARVLEVGCGEGYGTSLIGRKVREVTGLDIDPAAVDHAGRRYGSDRCRFVRYDGVRIPFADGAFDVAVSFQVIEHVPDDRAFVAEAHRVLAPGGIYMITTPNRTLRLEPGQKPWNRYHRREYYPRELTEILAGKFAESQVWGVKGRGEVQQLLTAKFRPGSPIVSFLRRAVPEAAKLAALSVRNRLPALLGGERDKSYLERYGFGDFYMETEDVDNTLDLFGYCRK
ncbi:MAG: class I SAM-dependent methyltransferase [Candidatus Glassbacteria bacterium]